MKTHELASGYIPSLVATSDVRKVTHVQGLLNEERRVDALARAPRRPNPRLASWLLAPIAATLVFAAAFAPAQARQGTNDLPAVTLLALPQEARETDRLIHAGGPFPYPHKDGSVFGNRERILPKRPRGEYREYTVKTPGSRDRGARRIVCAGKEQRTPEVCYYTSDHYSSFQRIQR